jgi:hypothetical protein
MVTGSVPVLETGGDTGEVMQDAGSMQDAGPRRNPCSSSSLVAI